MVSGYANVYVAMLPGICGTALSEGRVGVLIVVGGTKIYRGSSVGMS